MPNEVKAGFDAEKRVAQILMLRDKISEVRERHKAELRPLSELEEQLEGLLLQHLSDMKAKSIRTGAGTFFEVNKPSATLQDPGAFRQFVIDGHWDLCDLRANAPHVRDYIDEHNELPPGVKFSVFRSLSVRRSSEE